MSLSPHPRRGGEALSAQVKQGVTPIDKPERRKKGRAPTGRDVRCETCGEQFYAPGWRLARGARYCSLTCRPQSEKRRQAVSCATCGASFLVTASQLKKGKKYCSRACMGQGISPQRRGNGNPAWKGADTVGSIYRDFNLKLKGEACCRNCGKADVLHLHHIVPRSMCKAARRDLRNGVPLCASCHARWHARTITIYRDILTPAEWAYVSSLELLGQNITEWLNERYPSRASSGALKRTTGENYVPETLAGGS